MSLSRLVLSLIPLCALALSCAEDPDPSLHRAPEILDTGMRINESDVTLSCKVSRSDNIDRCGFYFGAGESEMKEYAASLPESDEFSFNVTGVTFGVRYYYRSFVSGGVDSRMSEVRTLEIDQRLPSVSIESLSVDGSRVACEYSVSGNFSGDLYFRGLCWNETGSPDIKSETKTLDGTEYGGLAVSLDDFEIGKTYCFRAYAGNAKGVVYSDEVKVSIPILFDDQTLYGYLLERYDEDSDGIINLKEAAKVTRIDIVSDDIHSLKGLEYLTNLDTLRFRGLSYGAGGGSAGLTEVDLSHVPGLSFLDLSCNKLRSLDLSPLVMLRELYLAGNAALGSDTFSSGLPFRSFLQVLDISGCPSLDPDLTMFSSLEELHYDSLTGISSTEPVFRNLKSLRRLYAGDGLKDGDKIYLARDLELLDCAGSQLSGLDLSYNLNLRTLNLGGCSRLSELDVCLNSSLSALDCLGSGIRSLYMVEGQEIDGVNVNLDKRRTIPEDTKVIYALKIKDEVFRNFLLDTYDTDYNSFVSVKEAVLADSMSISAEDYPGIKSLYGIGMFTSLRKLLLTDQKSLTELDLSGNPALEELQCDNVPLKSLNLGTSPRIRNISVQATALESFTVPPSVEEAYLSWSSALKTLDLSSASGLKTLYCDYCAIETLDITHCPSLTYLDCTSPSLKTVRLTRKQREGVSMTCGDQTTFVLAD